MATDLLDALDRLLRPPPQKGGSSPMDWDAFLTFALAWKQYDQTGKATIPVYVTLGTQKVPLTVTVQKDTQGRAVFTFGFAL